MNRFCLIAIITVGLLLAAWQLSAPQSAPVRDGVFVHLSSGSENAHRALMGLQMAVTMSQDRDVAIYADIEAVRLFLKDAAELKMEPFLPAASLIDTLAGRGVKILVCPTCLKVAGKSAEDLRVGAQLANKDRFFDFTKGRILTIDY